MYVFVFCGQQKTGSIHVQAVNQQRAVTLGIKFLQSLQDGIQTVFPGNRKHTGRFVYHDDPGIFVDYFQRSIVVTVFYQWIGIDFQTDQHVFQDGGTLSAAGRIKMSVTAYLVFRRVAPPEFSHSQRFQLVKVGILQQFG